CVSVYCFFFQAEDGIRDYKVTGVQTCALPIWFVALTLSPALCALVLKPRKEAHKGFFGIFNRGFDWTRSKYVASAGAILNRTMRSEERRVGKECRCPRRPLQAR